MTHPTRRALCALALALAAGHAFALDNARDAPPEMRMASDDRAFLKRTAADGQFEIDAPRLAERQAASPAVKQYAVMLVAQHTKSRAELLALARDKSVPMDDGPPDGRRGDMEALAKLQGRDFERSYVEQVGLKAHRADITRFETAARTAHDPELKAWAAKTLPSLKQHLAAAEKLAK